MYRYPVLSIGEKLVFPHFSQKLDNIKIKKLLILTQQSFSNTSYFIFQNKEIEELTKICDELIAKMGKS